MIGWWRRRRDRKWRERRYIVAMAWMTAELRGDDEQAAEFRRELDRMGGR